MSSTISSIVSSASSAVPSGLPDGVTPPPAQINGNDQAGLVAILAAFSLGLVVVSFPIRTYVRSKLGAYKADDYVFIAAACFSVLQSAGIFYMLKEGYGKTGDHLDFDNIEPMQKAAYSADILYVFTLFLSKCSTAFLFLRLTPGRGHWMAIYSTIWASVGWCVISVFLVAFRCHVSHPWTDVDGTCPNLFSRWIFIGTVDALTEVMLFSISIYLVWGIQMSMKSKSIVVVAFGCRVPVIALIAARLYYLHLSLYSQNPLFVGTAFVSCGQLEIGYSILASIVPCLKTFMMPYDRPTEDTAYPPYLHSHELGSVNTTRSEKDPKAMLSSTSSHHTGRSKNAANNVTVASLDRGNSVDIEGRHDYIDNDNGDMHLVSEGRRGLKYFAGKGPLSKLRPEQVNYEATVHSTANPPGSTTRHSGDSGGSQRMIIKKGVEWSVDYDTRTITPAEEDGRSHGESQEEPAREAVRLGSRGGHS